MNGHRIESTAKRRVLGYWAVGGGLAIGYAMMRGFSWQGGAQLHTLMEVMATLLAMMVGAMALVRFYSKKNNTFLFIGTGFLGTAMLDGYHAVVTSAFFAPYLPSELSSLIPWSWVASRLFLSVLLCLSWLAWIREQRLGESGRSSELSVYLISGALTLASFLFFAFVPLPRAYYPGFFFHRPEEFVPALFFLVALVGYLRKGKWRSDAFEHWLVLALIVGFVGQAMFMSFSGRLFDMEFDTAHLLKKVSYVCVLTGLLINMYSIFRQAAEDRDSLLREVEERTRTENELRRYAENIERAEEALRRKTAIMEMMKTVAVASNEAASVEEAMQFCIDTVCHFTGWPVGHVYMRDDKSIGLLRPTDIWHLDDPEQFAVFREVTERTRYSSGDGLPGRVLAYAKPAWIEDVTKDSNCLRKSKVADLGVRAAFAFPVMVGEKVEAVLEFFQTDSAAVDEELLTAAGHLGAQLGRRLERLKVGIARRELLRHNRLILDSTAEGVYGIDCNGCITFVNSAASKLLGYEPEELIGAVHHALIHHSNRDGIPYTTADCPVYAPIWHGKSYYADGELFWRRDGTSVAVECASTPIQNERNEIEGAVITFRDVTQRKAAELALQSSEARLRAIMENISDAIITIDETGAVENFNASAEAIFGYAASEVVGQNVNLLMLEPEHSDHDQHIDSYITTGEAKGMGATSREVFGRRKDGSAVPLEVAISQMQEGDRRKFIGTLRDISERKLVEQHLNETQRLEAIGQLAGGMAHDFNNILMAIGGFAKRALTSADDPDRLRSSLDEVIRSTDRGATLTRQLLMFGRRERLEKRVVRVARQVRESVNLLRPLIGETIELTIDISDNDACIEIDPNQLYQAIVNLAINARDAMPNGGPLTFCTAACDLDEAFLAPYPKADPGRYVRISVKDSGTGMDPDTAAHIFEPFFTTKEQGKGTGLGLAMVYGFVTESNGIIDVASILGEGSEFSIYLPVTDRQPIVVSKEVRESYEAKNETILLAEDNDAIRLLAQETLEDLGYKVLAASDGVEALEADEEHEGTIDLLVTDVVMPGLSGFDVARALKQSRTDIKIVFMSGYPERGEMKQDEVADDCPFLHKPFEPQLLARSVRETLDSRCDRVESTEPSEAHTSA